MARPGSGELAGLRQPKNMKESGCPMKRLTAVLLAMMLALSLTVPALAAETKPAPPAWVKAEEYLVIPGDPAYEKETWDKILKLRADAAVGHEEPQKGDALYDFWMSGGTHAVSSPAMRFELGLVGMKYDENTKDPNPYARPAGRARNYFAWAKQTLREKSGSYLGKDYQLINLWYYRAALVSSSSFPKEEFQGFLKDSGYTMEQFRSYQGLSSVPEEQWTAIKAAKTLQENGQPPKVWLDGRKNHTGFFRDGRVMVDIALVARMVGAEVTQTGDTLTLTRAGATASVTVGKTAAAVDGRQVTLEAAPCREGETIYVSAGCLKDLLGQKTEWLNENCCVSIMEDKGAAGGTNLENWALPMGAVLSYLNRGSPEWFGLYRREKLSSINDFSGHVLREAEYSYERCREVLASGWGIENRKDLIETVCRMTVSGHNQAFLADVAWINSMSASQYRQILRNASGMDAYMFPYTKQLGQKWGDRGILCWDLFRMSNLVQWGYTAGYITYPEALALLEPAAKLLHDNFKSWDEACENYLDGYYWWARENVLGKDPWTESRGRDTASVLRVYRIHIFDDSLFREPVKGVPGLTAESLLASVQ